MFGLCKGSVCAVLKGQPLILFIYFWPVWEWPSVELLSSQHLTLWGSMLTHSLLWNGKRSPAAFPWWFPGSANIAMTWCWWPRRDCLFCGFPGSHMKDECCGLSTLSKLGTVLIYFLSKVFIRQRFQCNVLYKVPHNFHCLVALLYTLHTSGVGEPQASRDGVL